MSVEEWEEKKAASQRGTFLALGGAGAVVLLGGALWAGSVFSPSPEGVVTDFLDAAVSDAPTGKLVKDYETGARVTGSVVRGYEVKNTFGDVVSATVIFASLAGTDLPKTLRFTVKDLVIVQIE